MNMNKILKTTTSLEFDVAQSKPITIPKVPLTLIYDYDTPNEVFKIQIFFQPFHGYFQICIDISSYYRFYTSLDFNVDIDFKTKRWNTRKIFCCGWFGFLSSKLGTILYGQFSFMKQYNIVNLQKKSYFFGNKF